MFFTSFLYFHLLHSVQLVYILPGHSLAANLAFMQFIIPSKAERFFFLVFFFILSAMHKGFSVHFPAYQNHFER